jgi:hypothetical protein
LKKTIDSPPKTVSYETRLLDKTDIWQKEHQLRRSSFVQSVESLSGTKYTYEPRKRKQTASERSS